MGADGYRDEIVVLLEQAAVVQPDDAAQARQLASRARVLARASKDARSEAESLYRLGSIAHGVDEPETAFSLALEAIDLAHQVDAGEVESWAVHLVGIVHYQAANFSDALDNCMRAFELNKVHGEEAEGSTILNTIAAICHSMGDTDRAIVTYEQALSVAEPYGLDGLTSFVLGNIARVRADRGEYLPAVSFGRRAVEIARVSEPSIVTNLLANLAEAYIGLGDHQKAAECFIDARKVLNEQFQAGTEPSLLGQLGVMVSEGRVALRRGSSGDAIEVLQVALDLALRTESAEYELEITDLLADALKRDGRFQEALERREQHAARHGQMFSHAADLRLRTLQVTHDTATARHQAEIMSLREQVLNGENRRPPDLTSGLPVQQLEAFEQLALLTELHDQDSGHHGVRVGDLAAEIAHAMGRRPEWCKQLRLAARLHDIGKVVVPDSVLSKIGPLTVEEYEQMKSHTSMGHRILAATSTPLFQLAAEIAQSHHEWYDGSGYPLGLKQESIPLSGRIVAVADVYDALVSRRPYKRPWSDVEAVRYVMSGRGTQFDGQVIEAFVTVLRSQDTALDAALG